MSATGVVALMIIVSVLVVFLLFMWMSRQDKKTVAAELVNAPETPLASLTLEAHFANQVLETAVTTGTAEEINDALTEVIFRCEALMDHLKEETAR